MDKGLWQFDIIKFLIWSQHYYWLFQQWLFVILVESVPMWISYNGQKQNQITIINQEVELTLKLLGWLRKFLQQSQVISLHNIHSLISICQGKLTLMSIYSTSIHVSPIFLRRNTSIHLSDLVYFIVIEWNSEVSDCHYSSTPRSRILYKREIKQKPCPIIALRKAEKYIFSNIVIQTRINRSIWIVLEIMTFILKLLSRIISIILHMSDVHHIDISSNFIRLI